MVKYENDCCDCAAPGYPCLGSSCPKRNVPHYYCDKCGIEVTKYELNYHEDSDEYVCRDCLDELCEEE